MARYGLLGLLTLAFVMGCGDDDGSSDSGAEDASTDVANDDGGRDSGDDDAGDDDAGGEDAGGEDAGDEDAGDEDAATDSAMDVPAPVVCADNSGCADDEYCAGEFAMCGVEGACELRPEACEDVVNLVCGCDDTTYTNPCEAAAAGVRVISRGACPVACDLTPVGGCCFTDDDCGGSTVCRGAACVADGAGTCVAAPTGRQCWRNEDCALGQECDEPRRCRCGVDCGFPDEPGTCVTVAGP